MISLSEISAKTQFERKLISIIGIPEKTGWEREVMNYLLGSDIMIKVIFFLMLFQGVCYFVLPYAISADVDDMLRSLNIFCFGFLYLPIQVIFYYRVSNMRANFFKIMLENQSLNTAFKELFINDLERGGRNPVSIATPQIEGTEMHREVAWLFTKATFLFWIIGWVLVYVFWYPNFPKLSLLPISWIVATSISLFVVALDFNLTISDVDLNRKDKRLISTAS